MSVKVGLVGLPNVGKSTLFNILTRSTIAAENYPFCTIEPNIGHILVNDDRINKLVNLDHPSKIVQSTIELYDIAGLVKGASNGEGLGNQFLANIREVDLIVHVIRCFKNDKIMHINSTIDPLSDKSIVDMELQLKDLESIDKKIEKTSLLIKKGHQKEKQHLTLLNTIREHLLGGNNIRTMSLDEDCMSFVSELQLLTLKPVVYVLNTDDDRNCDVLRNVKDYLNKLNETYIEFPIGLANDISSLSENEIDEFIKEYDSVITCINCLTKFIYDKLNIITFFTSGSDEVHAWTINNGTNACHAAGEIHSDFEEKFIKAEVYSFDDYCVKNNYNNGMRIEGKEYTMQDGDVVFFKIGA